MSLQVVISTFTSILNTRRVVVVVVIITVISKFMAFTRFSIGKGV